MKRSTFLKSLGLGAGGLILPINPLLNTKLVKIYDNYVRGLNHYEFTKVRKELKADDELLLVREKENKYDAFAVRVNFGQHRLGYLPAYENIVIANMLDIGVNMKASVSKISSHSNIYSALAVQIYAELITPTQKLVDELVANERASDFPDLYRINGRWSNDCSH